MLNSGANPIKKRAEHPLSFKCIVFIAWVIIRKSEQSISSSSQRFLLSARLLQQENPILSICMWMSILLR